MFSQENSYCKQTTELQATPDHTYPDPLHLCAERVKQLKEDQSQREDIHFVRIGVPTDLKIQNRG